MDYVMKNFNPLKNHEIRVKVANTKNDNEPPRSTVNDILNPANAKLIEETGKRFLRNLALTVVAAVVAIKVVDTLGEIAVKKTRSGDNPKD